MNDDYEMAYSVPYIIPVLPREGQKCFHNYIPQIAIE